MVRVQKNDPNYKDNKRTLWYLIVSDHKDNNRGRNMNFLNFIVSDHKDKGLTLYFIAYI